MEICICNITIITRMPLLYWTYNFLQTGWPKKTENKRKAILNT